MGRSLSGISPQLAVRSIWSRRLCSSAIRPIEARLQLLDPAGVLAAVALGGGRLGLAGARQLAARLSDLGAHRFFALDQIVATHGVAAQSATSGRRRVTASTSVSASAWSLYPWNEMRRRT